MSTSGPVFNPHCHSRQARPFSLEAYSDVFSESDELKFVLPPSGMEAELNALKAQLSRRTPATPIASGVSLHAAIVSLATELAGVVPERPFPACPASLEDLRALVPVAFARLVSSPKAKSSRSGYPLNVAGPGSEVKEYWYVGDRFEYVVRHAFAILTDVEQMSFEECANMSDEQMMQFSVVVGFFIKNEPHASQKAAEGRFRLISSVNLIWILIGRLLNDWLEVTLKATNPYGPYKPGMGLQGAQCARLLRYFERFDNPLSLDIKSMDWCAQLERSLARYLIGSGLGGNNWWLSMAIKVCLINSRPIFILSAPGPGMPAKLIRLDRAGITLSGGPHTSMDNTLDAAILGREYDHRDAPPADFIRESVAYLPQLVPSSALAVQGDDTVTTVSDASRVVEFYAERGYTVKPGLHRQYIDFCSHDWHPPQPERTDNPLGRGVARYNNFPKSVVNFICSDPVGPGSFVEFIGNMPNVPNLRRVVEKIASTRPMCVPDGKLHPLIEAALADQEERWDSIAAGTFYASFDGELREEFERDFPSCEGFYPLEF